jgi:hypothetical protein
VIQRTVSDFRVLASATTRDPSLVGFVVRDQDGLDGVWAMFEPPVGSPQLPAGYGAIVVAVESGTCHADDDVLEVEVLVDSGSQRLGVLVLDPAGELRRTCPHPTGAPVRTVFA